MRCEISQGAGCASSRTRPRAVCAGPDVPFPAMDPEIGTVRYCPVCGRHTPEPSCAQEHEPVPTLERPVYAWDPLLGGPDSGNP